MCSETPRRLRFRGRNSRFKDPVSSHPKKLELAWAWRDGPFKLLGPATEQASRHYELNEWMTKMILRTPSVPTFTLFPGVLAPCWSEKGRPCPRLCKWLDLVLCSFPAEWGCAKKKKKKVIIRPFHTLASTGSVMMNILVWIFLGTRMRMYLGSAPKYIFSFPRYCQMAFQSGYANLYPTSNAY